MQKPIRTINEYYTNQSTIFTAGDMYEGKEWYDYIVQNADTYIQVHYPNYIFNRLITLNNDDNEIINKIKLMTKVTLHSKAYTFANLYETTQLEYNPLWNVDGTETVTRTYSSTDKNVQDIDTKNVTSSVSNTDSTDNVTNDLTDTNIKTGTEATKVEGNKTTTNNLTDTLSKTGDDKTVTNDSSNSTITYNTTDTDTLSKTTDVSNTTEVSSTLYLATQTSESGTDTLKKTGTQKTENSGDSESTITYASTDTTTRKGTVSEDDDTTNTTTFNTNDKTTRTGTVDTSLNSQTDVNSSSVDSGSVTDDRNIQGAESITTLRQGNIGVTKTTDLIDSQRQTVLFDYLEYVCHAIIKVLCILVY